MNYADAERLYMENEHLVFSFLHKYYPSFAFDEDVQQIARMGLWRACTRFDDRRGTRISTFGYVCMHGAVARHFRNSQRSVVTSRSIDAPIGNFEDVYLRDVMPANQQADDCVPKIDFDRAWEHMSARDKKIIHLYSLGLTQERVGKCVGIGQVQVSRIANRLKKKITIATGAV